MQDQGTFILLTVMNNQSQQYGVHISEVSVTDCNVPPLSAKVSMFRDAWNVGITQIAVQCDHCSILTVVGCCIH